MPFAGNHFGRSSGTFSDLGMIQRGGDGITVNLAGLLDGGFPQLETAIGAGCGTSCREKELARKLLVVSRLQLRTERIFGSERLEIVKATRNSLDLLG